MPAGGLARVHARAQHGIDAPAVAIEAHLGPGLPSFSVVGLPETAVREARDRVKSAIQSSQLEFPAARITVNLAPADLPKQGGRFDLGIALAILAAAGVIPKTHLESIEVLGELGLSGATRAVNGALSAAIAAASAGRRLLVAKGNHREAALFGDPVIAANHLLDAVALLRQDVLVHQHELAAATETCNSTDNRGLEPRYDLDDVRGQATAKRALAIAAVGGHHLLFCGPPGAGKTMLAQRLPGLLPALSDAEARDVVRIHSAAGGVDLEALLRQRPYREPHHSASLAALVGGGDRIPRPGEISMAHHGVLFLDELPEFDRRALEALRQPLEGRGITLARARGQVHYPATFQLVAAMNPCSGGSECTGAECVCSGAQRRRYAARLSAPLLDRIDLHVRVSPLPAQELLAKPAAAPLRQTLREQVTRARNHQIARSGVLNRDLPPGELERVCALSRADQALLVSAADKLGLSARSCHRALRVARSIADLDGAGGVARGVASGVANSVERTHLTEALGYRSFVQSSIDQPSIM